MRAAILRSPGSTPVVGEHPAPDETAGRSVVRVSAAPVVPLDVLCATGTSYFGTPATPFVPGVQGVGRIESSGTHPVGSRVFFTTSAGMAPGDGSLGELCSVTDADLVAVVDDVDDAALAALGLSAVAAWMCLTWRAALQPGERVVVLGAGGAVGQAGIAAARALGAARVVGVGRSEGSAERARRAGADAVVTADERPLTPRLVEACDGPVDVVLDPVFGAVAEAALGALGEGGRLVNLGGAAGDVATFSSAALRSRSISVLGYTNNAISAAQRTEAITRVAALAAAGQMAVDHVAVQLDEVGGAWEATAAGRAAPRWVLQP